MINYGNTATLIPPMVKDVFGIMRPAFSPEAAELSATLCANIYDMNLSDWLSAGWMDVAIQTDGKLTSLGDEQNNVLTKFGDMLKMMHIKNQMSQVNAVSQFGIALAQFEESKAGNVVIMIHPAPGNKFVVAISFMGTGRRLADWMPNLRVSCEGGFHQGFLQLSRLFESNEANILFPRTAKQLGMQKLTLLDIIREMRSPDSRFSLWLTGHSLGGALIQMYAYHKIEEDSVLPQLICGYGFASPAVAKITAVPDPGSYPLFHIQNSDDIIPRVGAQVHLGECLRFDADEAFRSVCYTYSQGENSIRYRKIAAPFLNQIKDMSSCLVFLSAYLAVLSTRPHEEIVEHLSLFSQNIGESIKRLLANADQSVEKFLNFALLKVNEAHADIFDCPIDASAIEHTTVALNEAVEKVGMLRLTEAISDMVNEAHRIFRWKKCEKECAYMYIVKKLQSSVSVVPGIWACIDGKPRQIWADSVSLSVRDNRGHRQIPERRRLGNHMQRYSSAKSCTSYEVRAPGGLLLKRNKK